MMTAVGRQVYESYGPGIVIRTLDMSVIRREIGWRISSNPFRESVPPYGVKKGTCVTTELRVPVVLSGDRTGRAQVEPAGKTTDTWMFPCHLCFSGAPEK